MQGHVCHSGQGGGAARVSRDRWLDTQNVVYTYGVEWYSAIEWREILAHATIWMNHKDKVLREINWSQKTRTLWFHHMIYLRAVKFITAEESSGCQELGVRNGRLLLKGYGFIFARWECSGDELQSTANGLQHYWTVCSQTLKMVNFMFVCFTPI